MMLLRNAQEFLLVCRTRALTDKTWHKYWPSISMVAKNQFPWLNKIIAKSVKASLSQEIGTIGSSKVELQHVEKVVLHSSNHMYVPQIPYSRRHVYCWYCMQMTLWSFQKLVYIKCRNLKVKQNPTRSVNEFCIQRPEILYKKIISLKLPLLQKRRKTIAPFLENISWCSYLKETSITKLHHLS